MTGWGQDGPLAARAGHDINYISLTGALHAIGPADGPPQVPLNLLGDFAGGGMYLVVGILAALRGVAMTGQGEVIDASIVDGTSHLLAAMHGLLNGGAWADRRGANLLDGGAPFYTTYATADDRHMAVGAIEPKFFATFVETLGLDIDPKTQLDRDRWPSMWATVARAFRRRTQAEWTEIFEPIDACVSPVLTLREAALHPHVSARGSILRRDGGIEPSPAPRFASSRPVLPETAITGVTSDEVLAAWSKRTGA
jgi:alpha-methylacyl-CoA racemase